MGRTTYFSEYRGKSSVFQDHCGGESSQGSRILWNRKSSIFQEVMEQEAFNFSGYCGVESPQFVGYCVEQNVINFLDLAEQKIQNFHETTVQKALSFPCNCGSENPEIPRMQ